MRAARSTARQSRRPDHRDPPAARVRCVWSEGGPCTKVGHGRPPLCNRHAREADARDSRETERNDSAGDPIDRVFDRVDDLLENGTDRLVVGLGQLFIRLAQRAPVPGGRPAPVTPPPPPRPQAVEREDPREILGFGPDVKLTRSVIKNRQRALLALVHPDVGGSTRATQRINEASKLLLATVPA